jgi:restriction endonuclease S subunit
LINSLIGSLQLERIGTGGVQTNISSKDIFKILIPIIDKPIQEQIANIIQHFAYLKKQSLQLFNLAKQTIEIAIEKGEKEAMKFIGEQT